MTIGLIGWGRFGVRGATTTVPAPVGVGNESIPWLTDFIRANAQSLSGSFDVVQWPPVTKAQGGSGSGCDGYGVFDQRDIGSKNQQGGYPTRYGTAESLLAAVAALNAHGVASFGDLVLHQRSGENGGPGVFNYKGADGKTMNGRGPMTPSCFRGNSKWDLTTSTWSDTIPPFRPTDKVPVPADDFPFGRELVYENCLPARYTIDDALDFMIWITQRVGFAGYRIDDTKGMNIDAAAHLLWQLAMNAPKVGAGNPYLYSEYFDGNPANLAWWAMSPQMNGISGVEDFTMHWRIQAACNGFDATQLEHDGGGFWEQASGLAVGFVDNPDTDTSPGQQVTFNKGLAYAHLLTVPCRLAMVYGKDYFPSSIWPGAYGLHKLIDNLCWISRTFAVGSYEVRYLDQDVHVSTRDGNGGAYGWSGGLLTALNFNVLNQRTVTVDTPFGNNTQLHDYTGHHKDDIWTDSHGRVTFTIPSNAYSDGRSYLCFAPAGVNTPTVNKPRSTSQTFIGAADLDVMAVHNGMQNLPQRIRCASGTTINATLTLDRTGVSSAATVQVEVVEDGSTTMVTNGWATTGSTSTATAECTAPQTDWYTIRLVGNLLPVTGADFTLTVTYTGAI
jgi:alpha-amylase